MSDLLTTVIWLSVSGSLLALLLFALKPLLKRRLSKSFSYYIWLIVLLRLVLPIQSPIDFAGMDMPAAGPKALTVSAQQIVAASVPVETAAFNTADGAPAKSAIEGQKLNPSSAPAELAWADFLAVAEENAWIIWLCGAVICLGRFLISYAVFVRRILRQSCDVHPADAAVFRHMYVKRRVRFLQSDAAPTPMLIGLFRPVIVIPSRDYCQSGEEALLKNILRHELTHFRRGDLLFKWFTALVTSLHWFNPLMILVRREINLACELSCDEAVIKYMPTERKKAYGHTLLALSAETRVPSGALTTTLCEGKKALKSRISAIAAYKKKPAWAAVMAFALALMLTGCGIAAGVAKTEDIETPVQPAAEAAADTQMPEAYGTMQPAAQTPSESEQPEAAADMNTNFLLAAESFTVEELKAGVPVSVDLSASYVSDGKEFTFFDSNKEYTFQWIQDNLMDTTESNAPIARPDGKWANQRFGESYPITHSMDEFSGNILLKATPEAAARMHEEIDIICFVYEGFLPDEYMPESNEYGYAVERLRYVLQPGGETYVLTSPEEGSWNALSPQEQEQVLLSDAQWTNGDMFVETAELDGDGRIDLVIHHKYVDYADTQDYDDAGSAQRKYKQVDTILYGVGEIDMDPRLWEHTGYAIDPVYADITGDGRNDWIIVKDYMSTGALASYETYAYEYTDSGYTKLWLPVLHGQSAGQDSLLLGFDYITEWKADLTLEVSLDEAGYKETFDLKDYMTEEEIILAYGTSENAREFNDFTGQTGCIAGAEPVTAEDGKSAVKVRQFIGSMYKEAFGCLETTFRYENGQLKILKAECLPFDE